ncbi:threonine/serine dehydratase [Ferrovibrio sp.]|uniref:threonine ammonia-lyase n=1 Tax=Ferrovibrio sp. TaxID=1917215 RepID=UPI001B68ABA0|nr:threonine/serine dehydratase [Ferrovibrio sp.]MBP7064245.1 threonine/serine dehydratase [Ferrovibrio sp.]
MNAPANLPPLPTLADVEDAAKQLRGVALPTPLCESPLLNDILGCRLLVKAEPLQLTGSFKFRGAYNRLSRLNSEQRQRGVVAFSSGNHAQGVAYAAKLCGTPAVIVMPSDAPEIKVANTRAYGAEVVLYDRWKESREAIAVKYQQERGMILVPPFDDPHIICGQGTVGLEVDAQLAERGLKPDIITAGSSGGGLISGIALVMATRHPNCQVFAGEPADFDDITRSLASGSKQKVAADAPPSFCDALMAPTPGDITFAVMRRLLKGGITATDAEVEVAMATAFHYLKLVIEPGGAAALAALLHRRELIRGKTVVAVASGGNVDAALFSAVLARTPPLAA